MVSFFFGVAHGVLFVTWNILISNCCYEPVEWLCIAFRAAGGTESTILQLAGLVSRKSGHAETCPDLIWNAPLCCIIYSSCGGGLSAHSAIQG
jgi:hypothetical protein